MWLDIGAGNKRDEGYLATDITGRPDVICDARHLPFRNGAFGKVRMLHILEHIPREDLISTLNECHRVVESEGELELEVPIFPSDDAMADPTHVSFFVPRTFDYFVDGSGYDEYRQLYGIERWSYIERERLGFNTIFNVRLQKCE
jgi:ubiquinone/menaquinone biosynthesis C-methylase UbiE